MNVVTASLTVLCQALTVLLDFVVVLIVVRGICSRWTTPWLREFDEAGRPLIDRTLNQVRMVWNLMMPRRPMHGFRLLIMAVLVISILRFGVQAGPSGGRGGSSVIFSDSTIGGYRSG